MEPQEFIYTNDNFKIGGLSSWNYNVAYYFVGSAY